MSVVIEDVRLSTPGCITEDVTAAVHRPSRRRGPAVLLTPGAGGDLDTAGLVGLASGIAAAGHLVVRANLPYREAGRRPPRADRTVPAFAALLTSARRLAPRTPWVIGGKSYGGRVASLLAATGEVTEAGSASVVGVLCYGYPLHPPGKPDRLRVEHWPDIDVPVLFLQGDRDAFGGPGEIASHVTSLGAEGTVHGVIGGDHSLVITRKASPDGVSRRAEQVTERLGSTVAAWLAVIRNEESLVRMVTSRVRPKRTTHHPPRHHRTST